MLALAWVLCLAATGSAQAQLAANFTTPDARLSFWAPGTPRESRTQIPGKGKRTYQQATYRMEGSNYLLMAGVLDIGGFPSAKGDEDSFLNPILEGMQASFDGRFVLDANEGDRRLTYGVEAFPGRQLKGTMDGYRVTFRAYVAPLRIYFFQVVHRADDAQAAAQADRFLQSAVIDDAADQRTRSP